MLQKIQTIDPLYHQASPQLDDKKLGPKVTRISCLKRYMLGHYEEQSMPTLAIPTSNLFLMD